MFVRRRGLLTALLGLALGCQSVLGIEDGKPLEDAAAGGATLTDGGGGWPALDAGACTLPAQCDDGNPCNGTETCSADSKCEVGTPPDLDDGNSCTVDFCDAVQGIVHQPGDYPPTKACIATNTPCPANYYRAKVLLCDASCGACPFCVNGFECQRACVASLQACCGNSENCPTSCPAGYAYKGTVMSPDCGCGVEGPAAKCQRT